MPEPVKLLIVDQSLRDCDGHHLEYDVGVARGAIALRIDPIIAAHVDFDAALIGREVKVRRVFNWAWNELHHDRTTRFARGVLAKLPQTVRDPMMRAVSGAQRSWVKRRDNTGRPVRLPTFGSELRALIAAEKLTTADHVFIHTLSVAELHAFIQACARLPASPWLHVVLRRDADEPAVSDDQWGGITAAFAGVKASHANARLRFYADTAHLCRQYESLSGGLPVRLLPIPHDLPDLPIIRRSGNMSPARLTYLGNARIEKGFQHLPALVASLQRTHLATGRVRFLIQANSNMSLEEETIATARRRLAAYPKSQVELIRTALSITQFHQFLRESDLILLPYEPACYRRRSSGIMVQALVAGRPVIVPQSTWMSDCAPPGTFVTFEGPEDLPRAVAQAVDKLDELSRIAEAAAPAWRREHDSEALVRCLIDGT